MANRKLEVPVELVSEFYSVLQAQAKMTLSYDPAFRPILTGARIMAVVVEIAETTADLPSAVPGWAPQPPAGEVPAGMSTQCPSSEAPEVAGSAKGQKGGEDASASPPVPATITDPPPDAPRAPGSAKAAKPAPLPHKRIPAESLYARGLLSVPGFWVFLSEVSGQTVHSPSEAHVAIREMHGLDSLSDIGAEQAATLERRFLAWKREKEEANAQR